jgi:sugar phosphate isomerase/epimerase
LVAAGASEWTPLGSSITSIAMPLRRCFSTLGCPELSLGAVIALARKHEIEFVELRALEGSTDLAGYFHAQYGTPAKLAAAFGNAPLRITSLNASLHLAGATAAERDQLAALAPWADALGVPWLRVFDGGTPADVTEFNAARQTLQWWRSLRQAEGWQSDIMIETHDSLLTADTITKLTSEFPTMAILWDSHHTWRKGGEDPVTTWQAIRARVVHVHVKDSVNVASARHPFTYVLPGDGEFPIAPVLSALRGAGFDGPVSLEWEKLWHPYLPSLDEALTIAAKRNWW